MEVNGFYGKSVVAIEVKGGIESMWLLWKSMFAMESQ
jgi:hypothetical protein